MEFEKKYSLNILVDSKSEFFSSRVNFFNNTTLNKFQIFLLLLPSYSYRDYIDWFFACAGYT